MSTHNKVLSCSSFKPQIMPKSSSSVMVKSQWDMRHVVSRVHVSAKVIKLSVLRSTLKTSPLNNLKHFLQDKHSTDPDNQAGHNNNNNNYYYKNIVDGIIQISMS